MFRKQVLDEQKKTSGANVKFNFLQCSEYSILVYLYLLSHLYFPM